MCTSTHAVPKCKEQLDSLPPQEEVESEQIQMKVAE